MAKLAVKVDFTQQHSSSGHSLPSDPQPREDPRVLHSERGHDGGDDLRDDNPSRRGHGELDGDDHRPPVQPERGWDPNRISYFGDVTSDDLAPTVKLLTEWPPDLLGATLQSLYRYSARFDLQLLLQPPEEVAESLIPIAPYTFALGTGGVVAFYPIVEGLTANLQIHIWDPTYFRRFDLLRSIGKYAFKKWDLRRITSLVASRHTLALRAAIKFGFKVEGVMRQGVIYNGGVDDFVILGLLREEI